MRTGRKKIAKFAYGVEAFHAFVHADFWYSATTLRVLGVDENFTCHKRAAKGNARVSRTRPVRVARRRVVAGDPSVSAVLPLVALSVPATHPANVPRLIAE